MYPLLIYRSTYLGLAARLWRVTKFILRPTPKTINCFSQWEKQVQVKTK
jgi:hypothetical protein